MPLDLRGPQRSIAWQRVGDHLESVSVVRCGFMRLRGAFAGPEPIRQISLEPPVFLGAAEHHAVDEDALSAALAQPGADVPSGVRATLDEVSDGLSLWLALHEPALAWVSTIGAAADRALVLGVYYAVRKPVALGTAALVSTDSLAALVRLDDEQPFELGALPLGHTVTTSRSASLNTSTIGTPAGAPAPPGCTCLPTHTTPTPPRSPTPAPSSTNGTTGWL